jgi:monoamine oxidase
VKIKRRSVLAGGAATLALAACKPKPREIKASFTGTSPQAGHKIREALAQAPTSQKRSKIVIAGAGIAGLGAGYSLLKQGITDFVILDLEASAGGNSRSGQTAQGLRYPIGAHYLPAPNKNAGAVRELLTDLKLFRTENGRDIYDEKVLCHSPQERLLVEGEWQSGLLPQETAANAMEAFAEQVRRFSEAEPFALPSLAKPLGAQQKTLEGLSFKQFLAEQKITDPHLLWYLDYCCRDDYGAGPRDVSAHAGIAYFASRHGFSSTTSKREDAGVLTWPEGNGYLSRALADKLQVQLQTRKLVHAIEPSASGANLRVLDLVSNSVEQWQCEELVLALPMFIGSRLLAGTSPLAQALRAFSKAAQYAAWQVSNLIIDAPLEERKGAPRSWDNVVYKGPHLGYVDSQHQSFRAHTQGPTILTHYSAIGIEAHERKLFFERSPDTLAQFVLHEMEAAHPNIRAATAEVQITRYGHAMVSPTPKLRTSAALAALQAMALKPDSQTPRIHLAHSDLSGYSVFEEAYTWGVEAGSALGKRLRAAA